MDISTNLASQVGDGCKDAARQDVALDFREPQLDLIQPRRIGGREMQVNVRMREQEGTNGLCFMRREIVGDDVNLSPLRLTGHDLAEEFDKGGAGVPRHGLAEDLARLRIQRREERQRAVPVVLELTRLECANAGAPAAATSSSQYQLLKNRPFFSRASIEKMFVDDVELNENLGAPSAAASCAVQRMRDSVSLTDAS